ncbi:MAG TPA: hypothetical protein VLA43_17400, partial [Longimicrobiales bacterium]|nr:hypothetical protein [Longimicrobiales bacterium]
DGRYMAFSGMVGGLSDLFLWDFQEEELTQLTNDKYADFHPAWSPDGSTLAFATDRGEETDFGALTYSEFQIATLTLRNRAVRVLPLLGNVRHSNPQYGPDGRSLYFLSDADGFSDVYRTDVTNGNVFRVTRVATGVSGIVPMSPALSVAAETGDISISVFDEFGFTIHQLAPGAEGAPLARVAQGEMVPPPAGRSLPPGPPARFNLVATYLDDAQTGLEMPGTYQTEDSKAYHSSLALDYVGQPSIGAGTDAFGSYIGGGASAYFSDMLGNKVVGVALAAQGSFKDIGGSLVYADLGDRWNWAAGASRIPYQYILQGFGQDSEVDPDTGEQVPTSDPYIVQRRYRIFQTSASGQLSYPFSMTQRIEGGLGFTRYSFDVEEDLFYLDPIGRIYDLERRDRPDLERDPLNLGQASLALVGDNSFFGFVSPIRGGRYRFEVEGTVGTERFITGIADWRRYWAPHRNLTLGVRAMHYGRYGNITSDAIQPLFLGYETLIRGYAWESFESIECGLSQQDLLEQLVGGTGQISSCPTFDRLFGQRLGVFNLEARIPLIGTEQFGLINFGFLPTELSFFLDGGLAWDSDRKPVLEFSTSSFERVPVFATGVSARVNILGFLILETYYAYPFQRPDKGWHWGFNLAPGW